MSRPDVVVLDYGSGNLRSVVRALERAGAAVTLTADRATAQDSDGLVVPGVGAFAACMQGLRAIRGHEVIGRRLAGGRPVLGICVGMQILFERGGIAGPVSGNGADQPHDDENGIEHLWDELLQYRWDDKDLVQDCVTTLALGALRLEVPRRTVGATAFVPGGASTPLDDVDVDPLLAHASTLRAQMTVRPDHARRAHV